MLRLLALLIKASLFALVVLVAANYLRVGGKTISDQVRTHLARAEHSETAGKMRQWTGSLLDDAKKGARRIGASPNHRAAAEPEDISGSERKKLRDLIQELNRSHEQD